MNDGRRIDRMRGCACLGKFMLGLVGAALAVYCVLNLNRCFMTICYEPSGDQRMLRDLKIAITSYELENNRFPILETGSPGLDVSIRSQGIMLPMLGGQHHAVLNPKTIRFVELPLAKDRKLGLWQDGSEWVLSDSWGEPYHIILDTNEDKVITNPEFGADQSDPKYAEKCRDNPPPALPAEVIIYSSGPDRDPKTWHDNICSWRQ